MNPVFCRLEAALLVDVLDRMVIEMYEQGLDTAERHPDNCDYDDAGVSNPASQNEQT